MVQYTVEDMMKAYAEDAIDLGKQFGKHLDYSEKSIKENETKIFPPAKVYKRINNGSEENVWDYYQMVKEDFVEGNHGC